LTAFLGGVVAAFDVIVSADTLVYFGRLEDVVAALAQALRPGGRLIFTVEEWTDGTIDGAPATGYSLGPHGRFRHGHAYVERVLTAADLQPEIAQAELRLEAGDPVPGLVVRATRGSRCAVGPCQNPLH
jgi:predicted TPR repeat methyltransferase